MIINGQAVKGASRLAKHLVKPENEMVEILEISGTANDNLPDALRDMEALGRLTKSQTGKVLYHVNIDPRKGENLTAKDYIHSADRLMDALDLTGQPRALVMHVKEGRQHAHLVVQLTDDRKGKLLTLSNDYYAHQATARILERELSLQHTQQKKTGRSYDQADAQKSKKTGDRFKDFQERVITHFKNAKDGIDFKQRLEKGRMFLAQGKRLVLIDREGSVHSLTRILKPIGRKKDIMAKIGHVVSKLPSVELVQEKIRITKSRTNTKRLDSSQDAMGAKLQKFKLDQSQNAMDKKIQEYRRRERGLER